MDTQVLEVLEKITSVPLFLFLGQNYQTAFTGTDYFLTEIFRKYGPVPNSAANFFDLFSVDFGGNKEASISWMQSRGERFTPPSQLELLSKVLWSGIYTSSIDNIWYRPFRNDWRTIQPIFEEKFRPADPRNRTKLHITHLFGCVDRVEESQIPPLTKIEWIKRKQDAITLARRLPEYVTPFGLLVIEGYKPDSDWLKMEDLFPILDSLEPNQTYLFGADDSTLKDEYVQLLIEKNKLIPVRESLFNTLVEAQTAGLINLDRTMEGGFTGKHIQISGKNKVIPSSLFAQTSNTCTVLDSDLVKALSPLSPDREYAEYRNFLGEVSTQILWEGFARGFAFKRAYEGRLARFVEERLESSKLFDEPVILAGQTGSGKTVALGALAYKVHVNGIYPVLYIGNNVKRPSHYDIDAFCQWAENEGGAHKTLIVWDGMVDIDEYYDLTKFLYGRGRKVVVVGSAYWYDKLKVSGRKLVKAPGTLTSEERKDFAKYLDSFQEPLNSLFSRYLATEDEYFLVALYRLLPTTRSQIQAGLVKELNFSEQKLTEELCVGFPTFNNCLGHALVRAKVVTDDHLLRGLEVQIGGEAFSESRSILGLIMVPGRFGLSVPLEIILRAIGRKNYADLVHIINSLDIIKWHEDNGGNIFLAPRTSLEAKLLCYAEMGGAKTEIEFAKKLIFEVKYNEDSFDNIEVDFAVELLRNLGPNGPAPTYYSSYYVNLSEALTQLREERGLIHPRLMLQEATLLREDVTLSSRENKPIENSLELIKKAESILNEILRTTHGQHPSTRSIYLVELAAIMATKLRYMIDFEHNAKEVESIYKEITKTIWKAHSYDEEYYPLDIIAWVGPYLLKQENISRQLRDAIRADILFAFDLADSDELGSTQTERLRQRKLTAYSAMGEIELSDQAFEELRESGSCIGFYIKAHEIAGKLPVDSLLSSEECRRCSAASSLLESEYDFIKQDVKTLYLFLKLWWMKKTGQPFFYRERQAIPFSQDDWNYLLKILRDLRVHPGMDTSPTISYLSGLAEFHLSNVDEALAIFRDLERVSDYLTGRRRLIKAHLASMPDGTPRKYTGEVAWVRPDNSKGEIYIPELRKQFPFSPRDFGRLDIKKDETLGEFHLAFNFRGPLVDPTGRVR